MNTSSIVSDRNAAASQNTMYEPRHSVATDRLLGAVTGAVLGATTWLLLTTMGVHQVFRVAEYDGVIPFALLGALASLTRARRYLCLPAAAMTMVLLVVAYTSVVESPVRSLVRADPLPSRADAIVVLSAGINPDGLLGFQAMDRIMKGIELVQAGIAPTIVTTRERIVFRGKEVTSEQDQKRLLALGGIKDAVVTPVINNTREEAVAVARMARDRGWRQVVLVTSPAHSRRACATFEKAGVSVSCTPSHSRDVAFQVLGNDEDRIAAFRLWLYEQAGTIRYQWSGWL